MSRKHSTKFITDESQVPDGYVPLASFYKNKRIHRALCDAHKAGSVRAVKLVRHEGDIKTGTVWVHSEDAKSFEHSYGREAPKHRFTVGSRMPLSKDDELLGYAELIAGRIGDVSSSLEEMREVLERLTSAVESMATQPKTTHQELLHSINGNSASWNET
jgi:hypothetical protein